MAYPEAEIFDSERGGYTRAWLTHGLIEAGYAGNPKAFPMLRGHYDWYDRCPYLPEALRRSAQGIQGMVANTRMYFTPIGKPEDVQVVLAGGSCQARHGTRLAVPLRPAAQLPDHRL